MKLLLPIAGQSIAFKSLGFVFELSIAGGFLLQIENHVQIEAGESSFSFTPAPDVEQAHEIARVMSGTIESSSAQSGILSVTLISGTELIVHPDADFEAWNITGPGGFRVVCMPGGEMATWSPQ
ncbi:DUF6188 family protein [Actinomycetes bacterium M1A6_2h]